MGDVQQVRGAAMIESSGQATGQASGRSPDRSPVPSSDLRMTRIPLSHGSGRMPALGFGTLIPDAAVTITATRAALDAGFRHLDCAERYGNEREVGTVIEAAFAAGGIAREDIF